MIHLVYDSPTPNDFTIIAGFERQALTLIARWLPWRRLRYAYFRQQDHRATPL